MADKANTNGTPAPETKTPGKAEKLFQRIGAFLDTTGPRAKKGLEVVSAKAKAGYTAFKAAGNDTPVDPSTDAQILALCQAMGITAPTTTPTQKPVGPTKAEVEANLKQALEDLLTARKVGMGKKHIERLLTQARALKAQLDAFPA